MKSSLLTRVVAGTLVATSAFVSTNLLLAQSTTAPATSAPASQPTPAILAVVNGREISTDKFDQLLMAVAGMRLLEQVIDLMVAEQACIEAGVPINTPEFQKNVQAELDRALNGFGDKVPEKDRGAALAQLLRSRGITNVEFQMGLRRAACLRALAQGKVTITDDMVKQAYDAEYGERMQGYLFVVPTIDDASAIRKALTEQGKSIMEVATSFNGQSRIIPMSDKAESVEKLRTAALKAGEKQLSAAVLQPNNTYALFYLEKVLPAQKDVSFDSVKDKIRTELQDQGDTAWANNHLQNLRRMATIRINDPILSQQYEEMLKQMQAAATQNATQPAATAPAR